MPHPDERYRRARRLAACLAALGLALAAPLSAQDPPPRALTGSVVDARTGDPIEGAVVVLEPASGGVTGPDRASSAIRMGLTATTEARGRYTFRGLPAGAYRLRVSAYAYEPATVEIDVRRGASASVSVGLVVDPVAMEPVEVILAADRPARDAFTRERDARVALERERQETWLPSDVRAVTRHDVVDGVTLGESDLFRALQRLPGVTTRDDYTAELWTRGAPWSHTLVTFDGLPLYNPLHGVGVFGGVNPDVVGAAFFFPGARPASVGGGAAGVVELASRPPSADEELRGVAEVSLVSARAAFDRGSARGGWLASARRSWLDLVTWAIDAAGGTEHVPYAFTDLAARGDLSLGSGRALEASALWITDDVRDDVPDVEEAGRSHWGNALARATLETPLAGLALRHTVGVTRFSAEGLSTTAQEPALFDPPGHRTDHEVLHWTAATAIGPGSTRGARWSAGAAVTGETQRYRGPAPTPHPGVATLDSLSTDQDLTQLALWGERRLAPTASFYVDVGARAEVGGGIADAPALRLAPRLAARWSVPGGRLAVSAAWTRAWQYAQTLGPAGLSVGPRLHPNEIWFLADETVPALRSDVATLGGEAWIGEAWLASATGWLRRTEGVTLPDPTPGPIEDPETLFPGTNRAHGVDLSLRRLFGRWTAALGYAWTRSESEVLGWTYPASSERRHVVDAVASTRIGEEWRVGAAWKWASGAPFTRFFAAVFGCGADQPCAILAPAVVEEPNAERGPTWSTLDLLAEWTRDQGRWSLSVFGQLSNALDRDNALTYVGSERCGLEVIECPTAGAAVDEFEPGLPILPIVGVRMAF